MPRLAGTGRVRSPRVLLHDVPPEQAVISQPPRVLTLPQRNPELLLPLDQVLQVRLTYLHPPNRGVPNQAVDLPPRTKRGRAKPVLSRPARARFTPTAAGRLIQPREACSSSRPASPGRPAIEGRSVRLSAARRRPERRSDDGQTILERSRRVPNPVPDLLTCGTPLRNRTVDLLLTMGNLMGSPDRRKR